MASASENRDAGLQRWSLSDWHQFLQSPGRRLIELHAITENSFLEIGESLQTFYRRAGDVSSVADRVADDLLGDSAGETISRLQLLVERMNIYLSEITSSSQQNEQTLTKICSALLRLKEPLGAFQKITKTLQVIGITTRVECSGHVESGSENSSVLSDSLRRLASLIAVNMEAIVEQVGLLQGLSEDALKNETVLHNEQSRRAQDAVDHARSVLLLLADNHRRAAEKSDSLAQCSTAISRSIGEIVSSMQFHDITRQQIEHVSQTIDALEKELTSVFAGSDAQSRNNVELAVAQGCRLQAEQLGHARNELTSAVWRIIESLHALSASVTELSGDTCELAGTTERDGATYFAALEPAIESVAGILVENSNTAGKSLQAVVNVVCAAEEMSALVEEIERFGAEMKVLSLNASVEAVHAKRGGSSLSVIADSIQDLANDALLQTERLASGLKEITLYAETLGGGDVQKSLRKAQDVDQLNADAEGILEQLRNSSRVLAKGLAQIEQQSGTLAVDIAETAANICIHDDSSSILTRAIEDLQVVVERFPGDDEVWQKVQHIPLFREMHSRYSMKSERDIHLRVLNRQQQEPAVVETEKETYSESTSGFEGLGSNIELF